MVTALRVGPGEHPCIVQLCDDGDHLRRMVSIGTDWVCDAKVLRLDDGIGILVNEDAEIFGLVGNRRVGDRVIAGVFYVVAHKDGQLVSLTDAEIVRYTARFWEPESYATEEVLDSYVS